MSLDGRMRWSRLLLGDVIPFLRLKRAASYYFMSNFVDNWTQVWKESNVLQLSRGQLGFNARRTRDGLGLEAHQWLHDTWAVSCSQEGGCEWYTPRGSCQQNICFMAVISKSQCRTSLSGSYWTKEDPLYYSKATFKVNFALSYCASQDIGRTTAALTAQLNRSS